MKQLNVVLFAVLFLCVASTAFSSPVAGGRISVYLQKTGSSVVLSMSDSARKEASISTIASGGVRFVMDDGKVESLAQLVSGKPSDGTYRCLTDSGRPVDIKVDARKADSKITIQPIGWKAREIRITLGAADQEDFYGGGEVWNGSVNQQGMRVNLWVQNGTPDECCYVPFFFSSRGYGIFVDSYEKGYFIFGPPEAPKTTEISFKTAEKSNLTFYFIGGPHPKEIITNYTAVSGRPPLPPKWSFQPWVWRDKHEGWHEVFEDAEGMRKYDIPCSLVWIDNPWQKYGLCSFEFDPIRFPDAPERIKDLKKMGYKVMLWVAPFTNPGVPNYQIALERNYLVKNVNGQPGKMGGGYYIDLTNPEAYNWWKEEMKKVIRLGVDGFKLDRGQDIPEEASFFDGSTGSSMHNRYALLFSKVCFEALNEELRGDFTMLPRPGCAGSQVYSSGKWPGDLSPTYSREHGLASAIPAGLNIGLSGFAFWGSDIGGFERGGPETRLLLRWAQFGCFSPIMELGGQDPHNPWNPKFGPEAVPVYRYFATLHNELLPYTYTYAAAAHKTGLPIIRPLVLEFPDDATARKQSYEYTYGEHFLVAPIYTEKDARDVYIPQGEWVDFWDWNKLYKGKMTVTGQEFPISKMPLYLRNGAIIPLEVENNVTGHGDAYSKGKLTVVALPKGESQFRMLDGKSETVFKMAEANRSIKFSWSNTPKPLLLRIRAKGSVDVVSATGRSYRAVKDYTGKPGTWSSDPAKMLVLVSPFTGDTQIVVRLKKPVSSKGN